MMFMGEFSHTIDTKGRLIIPAKLREQLGESCIMTKSFDNCLAIYTSEMFAAKAAALMNQPNGKAGVRGLKRQIFANATELEFDRQGRILVPATLREYAKLQKEVMVIGVADHVEIWNREHWMAYQEDMDDNMEQLSENMEDFLL